jgi:hypothetical protein
MASRVTRIVSRSSKLQPKRAQCDPGNGNDGIWRDAEETASVEAKVGLSPNLQHSYHFVIDLGLMGRSLRLTVRTNNSSTNRIRRRHMKIAQDYVEKAKAELQKLQGEFDKQVGEAKSAAADANIDRRHAENKQRLQDLMNDAQNRFNEMREATEDTLEDVSQRFQASVKALRESMESK